MMNTFGDIMQLGYIVKDVPAAAEKWAGLGIGPFYFLENQVFDNYYFRGVHTDLELSMAFGYWGDMQVELIQPINNSDNLYTQAIEKAPGKLNHYATVISDLESLLDKHNLRNRIIHNGSMPSGVNFAYLEEFVPGGFHLELIQAPETALQGFAGMKAIAKTWDGTRPVRSMMSLGDDLAALRK